MFKGQILTYHFNSIHNVNNGERNIFTLTNVNVETPAQFRNAVEDCLDVVPPGKGYVLIKWNNKLFIAERDVNNPTTGYIRYEINYHPLSNQFTI